MNNAAATRRDHRRQNSATHQKCSANIDRKYPVPVGQSEIEHRTVRIVAGSAVDQNLDGRKFVQNHLCRGFDIRLVANIATHAQGLDTAFRNRRGCCFGGARIQVDAGDRGSSFTECERDRLPDTVAGTGHDRGFSCQ